MMPGTPQQRKASPQGHPLRSVRRDELLPLDEVCRRFGFGRDARRRLHHLGLTTIKLGGKHFTTGEWIQELFDRLEREQNDQIGGHDA